MKTIIRLLWSLLLSTSTLFAIDNLKLNPHLDYDSDTIDGPLITGSDAQSGFVSGKTNYVIMYGEGCFNSKRQARRTVELYNKYRSQVHFVVIDLDVQRSPEQQELVKKYYKGYIPHVVVLDAHAEPLYNQSGEVDSGVIEDFFKRAVER
jgi:thiol-disulfide isomerase/thioredoxin